MRVMKQHQYINEIPKEPAFKPMYASKYPYGVHYYHFPKNSSLYRQPSMAIYERDFNSINQSIPIDKKKLKWNVNEIYQFTTIGYTQKADNNTAGNPIDSKVFNNGQKVSTNSTRQERNDSRCQNSEITEDERAEILDLHNKYRSDLASGKIKNKIQNMPNGNNIRKMVGNKYFNQKKYLIINIYLCQLNNFSQI